MTLELALIGFGGAVIGSLLIERLLLWALVVLISGPRQAWQSWLLVGFVVGVVYMTAVVVLVLRRHGIGAFNKEEKA